VTHRAAAINFTIPPSLMSAADHVIEALPAERSPHPARVRLGLTRIIGGGIQSAAETRRVGFPFGYRRRTGL
jgi:hypothetical protein